MQLFTARYLDRECKIVVYKDLSRFEFRDIVKESLQIDDDILGFRDFSGTYLLYYRVGVILTISTICEQPESIKNEPYEVIVKQSGSHPASEHRTSSYAPTPGRN